MVKNMKLFLRVFTLALMAAFFLRPVVVCVHNGAISGKMTRQGRTFWARPTALPSFQPRLRTVDKEAPPALALVHCLSRAWNPSPSAENPKPAPAFPTSSPPGSIILRI